MGQAKILAAVVAAAAIGATLLTSLLAGPTWAAVSIMAGVAGLSLTLGYIIVKQLQQLRQRVTQLQRQDQSFQNALEQTGDVLATVHQKLIGVEGACHTLDTHLSSMRSTFGSLTQDNRALRNAMDQQRKTTDEIHKTLQHISDMEWAQHEEIRTTLVTVEAGVQSATSSARSQLKQAKQIAKDMDVVLRRTDRARRQLNEMFDRQVETADQQNAMDIRQVELLDQQTQIFDRQTEIYGMLDLVDAQMVTRLDQFSDETQQHLNQLNDQTQQRLDRIDETGYTTYNQLKALDLTNLEHDVTILGRSAEQLHTRLAEAADNAHAQLEQTHTHLAEMTGNARAQLEQLVHNIDRQLAELRTAVHETHTGVSAVTENLTELDPQRIGQGLEKLEAIDLKPISQMLARLDRDVYHLSYQIPREIESSGQLFSKLAPKELMPASGGWALSPLGILEIVRTIMESRPQSILECGSGTSTIWMALALQRVGHGHVHALEHDERHLEQTKAALERHGLTDFATVTHAPLATYEVDGSSITWYSDASLDSIGPVDLALIDGPPAAVANGRSHTMTFIHDRLAPEAWIFVDDVHRIPERTMVQQWLETYPDLEQEDSATKLQAVLRRRAGE